MVTFTVTAEDLGSSGVPDTTVILSLTNSVGGLPSGSATADGANGTGLKVTAVGRHVTTLSSPAGQVTIHYTAASTPSPFPDIVSVLDYHGAVLASTLYAYSCFAPQAVGRPVVTTFGTQTLVFWRGSNNDLWEAWYSGAWNGPVDLTATQLPSNAGPLASAPSVLIYGSQVVIFWQGTNNDLWEAWYSGRWNGAVDLTATQLPSKAGPLASAPSVLLYGSQLVIFWQGTNNDLWEAWYSGRWNGAVDLTATQLPSNAGQLASAPSVLVYGSQVVIFWQGTNNDLWEAWFSGRWFGAVDLTATQLPSNAGPLASAPSVLLYGSQVVVFWQGSNNDLWEAWFSGRWFGAVDLTATQLPSNAGPLASAPSVLVYGNQVVIFWQGTNNDLWEAWYGNGWNGALDWTKALGSTGTMTSPPTLLLVKRGPLDVFWQGTGQTLWEAWYQGGWFGPLDWSAGGIPG